MKPLQQRRAAIYTRISLDKSGEGIGVERQEQLCKSLADLHGFVVEPTHILRENDKSAFKAKVDRPRFTELKELIAAGTVERVYVYSADRLARRTADLLALMELMKPRGVTVHAVDGQGIDPSSANGTLITTILGAVAEQESAHKGERISAAFRHRAKTGQPKTGGRRLFGYERDGKTIVEAEAKALREAAQLTIDGTRSLRGICADWKAAGITSTTGREMIPPTLRIILTNPYIAALSTYTPVDERGIRGLRNREILAVGTWDPILDRPTWDALQRAIAAPDRKTNHVGNTPKRLMSGLLVCPCGEPMYHRTRKRKDGEPHSYYACKKTVVMSPGFTHTSIGADDTDNAAAELIIQRLARTDLAEALGSRDADDASATALATAMRDRDTAMHRRTELETAYADGALTLAVLTRTSTQIDELLTDLDGRIASLASQATTSPLAQLVGVADLRQWWAQAPLETRRWITSYLVTITVGPGRHGAKAFDPTRLRVVWKEHDK